MNRRSFLRRVAVGTASALVLANVPVSVVKAVCGQPATRESAIAIMTRCYNAAAKGKTWHETPRHMIAGRALFDAFESEIVVSQRIIEGSVFSERTLRFKTCTIYSRGTGYVCRMTYDKPAEWERV